jgi:hypothetical protein
MASLQSCKSIRPIARHTRLCSHSSRDDDNIRSTHTMQTSVKIYSISNELITLLVYHIGLHSLRRCYPRDTSCAARHKLCPVLGPRPKLCPVLCLEAQVVPRFVKGGVPRPSPVQRHGSRVPTDVPTFHFGRQVILNFQLLDRT